MELIGINRFDFSEKTKPLANKIILTALPFVEELKWTNEYTELFDLDLLHGIDLLAITKKGPSLSFQVKVLSKNYNTITVECDGIDKTGAAKQGDWNNCIAQYQLIIYSLDGETISRWCILDNSRLNICSNTRKLRWIKTTNKNSHAASDFKYIDFNNLAAEAPEAIVYYGGDWAFDNDFIFSRYFEIK